MRVLDSPIAETPDEWLTAIFRPISLVVKLARVPDDFVEELAHAHGVAGGAGAAGLERPVFWVGHVCHVVWRVQVDTIPAARAC